MSSGPASAYLIYFRLIRAWGATRTAAVTYILPVVGIALGVIVANETIDLRVVAGRPSSSAAWYS